MGYVNDEYVYEDNDERYEGWMEENIILNR